MGLLVCGLTSLQGMIEMMNDESHTLFANTFDTAFSFAFDEMKY